MNAYLHWNTLFSLLSSEYQNIWTRLRFCVQKNSDSTNGITEENCTPGSHSETPFRKNFLTYSTFGSCTPKENGFQSIIAPRMKVKMWGVEVLYFVLEAAHLHEGLSSSIKIGPKKRHLVLENTNALPFHFRRKKLAVIWPINIS